YSARAALAGWIDRLCPSWPEAAPSRLRRSSDGVSSAPAATITVSVRTRIVPPRVVACTSRTRPRSSVMRSARAFVSVVAPARCALVDVALLEDRDAPAGLGQQRGDGRATGARADDAGVGGDDALAHRPRTSAARATTASGS